MSPSDVAREAVKGLSGSPVLLLIAVLNVIMIGTLLYVANSQKEERSALMASIIDNCRGH